MVKRSLGRVLTLPPTPPPETTNPANRTADRQRAMVGVLLVLSRWADSPAVVCPWCIAARIVQVTSRSPSHGGVLGERLALSVWQERRCSRAMRSRVVRCSWADGG